jgi:hypothetical protein
MSWSKERSLASDSETTGEAIRARARLHLPFIKCRDGSQGTSDARKRFLSRRAIPTRRDHAQFEGEEELDEEMCSEPK